jgi:ABC-2 type transport system permease protein
LRLQRATLLAWTGGLLVLGFVYGAIANDIGDFVADNQTLKDLMAAAGGANLTDAYFGTAMLTLALVASGYAVGSVQRLRTEETTLRAEPILSTPTSRRRWMASHLALALGGSTIVMAAAGLGTALPYAIAIGDAGQIPKLVSAALAYLPATWILVGVAATVFGAAPRAYSLAWVALAACFVIGFLGEVLKLPHWIIDLSPFQHTPHLPAAPLTVTPLLTMLALAAALTTISVIAFRRRDIG